MEVSIYEAKTHLSKRIDAAQRGEEVIVARRNKPAARIVSAQSRPGRATRIGGLAGRPFRLAKGFDKAPADEAVADLSGVPKK